MRSLFSAVLAFFSKDQRVEPVPSSVMDNLNIGVHFVGGKMYVLIPINAEFPLKVKTRAETSIDVYEGESSSTKENILIRRCTVDGLLLGPKDIANCKLCFEVDANGTSKVTSVDTIYCNMMKEITIVSDERRSAKICKAKLTLLKYACAIMYTFFGARLEGALKKVAVLKAAELKVADNKKILNRAKKAFEQLKRYEAAKMFEFESRPKELEALWNPIVTKLYQDAVSGPSPLPEVLLDYHAESCRTSPPPKAGSVLDEVD